MSITIRQKMSAFCNYNGKCLILPITVTISFILITRFYTPDIRRSFTALLPYTNKLQNNSLVSKMFPTQIADWISLCSQISPLIVLEPQCLRCLNATNETCCSNRLSGTYRFAIRIEDQNRTEARSVLLKIAKDSIALGWQSNEVQNSDKAIILKKATFAVFVSFLDQRQHYWYLHGSNGSGQVRETPRGFVGLNLHKFELGDRNESGLFIPSPIDFFLWQWPRSTFLECNRSSAEYCRRQYPDIYNKAPRVKDSFIEILAYCRDLFLKHRITILLAGGTQLGWYRECGIIPHTTDTDMAYLASEWKPELERVLQADKVLRLHWILGKPDDGYEMTVYHKDTKIDLFGLYQDKNRSYVGALDVSVRQKLRWWYPQYVGACAADLKGHLFYVRCDIVEALTTEYGPEWYEHHHSDKFAWQSSHKNVENVGTYNDSEWPSVYRTF